MLPVRIINARTSKVLWTGFLNAVPERNNMIRLITVVEEDGKQLQGVTIYQVSNTVWDVLADDMASASPVDLLCIEIDPLTGKEKEPDIIIAKSNLVQ